MAAPEGWSLTHVSGKDAKDFLQRISTVDLRKLTPGTGSPAFILHATGRVRAAFDLWCVGEGEYLLETGDDVWTGKLRETLEFYHFGEAIEFTAVVLECLWFLAENAAWPTAIAVPPAGATAAVEEDALDASGGAEIRLFNHGDQPYGRAWLSAWGRPDQLAPWADRFFSQAGSMGEVELDALRVRALGALAGHELTEEVNPLEAGGRAGIWEGKGCYPGQEVIEKLLAFAAPARRLARLRLSGPPPVAGEVVWNEADPPAEVGIVTTAEPSPGGNFSVLAVLKKIHAREGLGVRLPSGAVGSVEALA
jgi:folate-binding protein YgfZ